MFPAINGSARLVLAAASPTKGSVQHPGNSFQDFYSLAYKASTQDALPFQSNTTRRRAADSINHTARQQAKFG
ncbi:MULTISPECIES: hypothetical protein [Nitrosomonas]|uniref:hypothetical protein n=1 Tax=Nitrosomonas TaxID=914 RepID=UPI0011875294|nr:MULTISPECIES: hypothetical protein [Nitrosomonas]UVS62140.1 hypothetical protein NX761_03130 [Nitrosomonas sp. PLL12]